MTFVNFLSLFSCLLVVSCVNVVDNSGKSSYQKHCSGCHGVNGEGLGTYIPPLRNADYLKEHHEQLACIIKYGISGEIVVNGITYSQPMGGITELDDAEMTNLINYIRAEFLNNNEALSVMDVSNQIANCN